jgi:pimeloyl-ACP methyl ester carboxylesterase
MCLMLLRATIVCAFAFASTVGRLAAEPVDTQGPLALQSEGSFFIGGTAHHATGLSGLATGPEVTREGTITTGQMYVQYQVPARAAHLPVVMVHGGGLSGQAWETTPDGRMGWSEHFLRSGRPVYLVDQASRARSGFDATGYNAVKLGEAAAKDASPILIIGHEYAWTWFRIGPKFGVPFADTQFPVNAVDEFYKMWIPDMNATLPADNPSYADLAALSKRIGGAIVMGHSESFMFPERAALADPSGVKGMISLESGYACATRFTDQELASLAKIPLLIVFADHHADAPEPFGSRWTTSMQQCRDFAASISKAGGDVTFMHLPELGIHGNTHMFMLDKNNLQIADLLFDWMDRHVEHRSK